MRLLILTQYYPPEPGSSAMRMSEMAEHFASRGHEVTVITGFPNYPSGRIYSGYRGKIFLREERNGVRIRRVFLLTVFQKRKFVSRMGNYLSFMLTSIIGAIFSGKHDLIYFYSPPIFLGFSAYILSRIYGIPFVFELNDLWPKAPIALGVLRNKWLIKLSEAFERFVYRKANTIFLYSNTMRQKLVEAGVPLEKTEIHYLWVQTSFFRPQDDEVRVSLRKNFNLGGRFVAMYAGLIGMAQGIGTVIESANLLRDRHEIVFALVGGGSERDSLMKKVEEMRLRNVIFIPQQPVYAMPGMLSAGDVLLVHLDKAPHRLGTIPAKTLAYMSCGKAVLMAAEGESAILVERSKCGVVIQPQKPDAMAQAALWLSENDAIRSQMGSNGRAYAIENFDQAKVLKGIEESFQRIIQKARRAR